jgi:glycosyltransferase involved in cell wall biosynthesis
MSIISIVVPVYNNSSSLADLLTRFKNLAAKNEQDQFEFVFVDDGSVDTSFAVLQDLLVTENRLRILSRNFGSNAALLAGLGQSHGDVVAAIAADLQDPPELIDQMLIDWRQGQKVVLAARESRGDDLITTLLSDSFYFLFRRLAIKTMPIHGFDFFLIDRQVVDLINGIQENNAYLMGLILWLGFTPKTIMYHRKAREKRYGRSMWTFAKKLKYFLDSFVAFSYFPVRAASVLGVGLSLAGLLYAVFIFIMRFIFSYQPEGWSSLMIVLLIVSGVQMSMIGILGEYLWRNLDETRRRPRFIIEKIIKSDSFSN